MTLNDSFVGQCCGSIVGYTSNYSQKFIQFLLENNFFFSSIIGIENYNSIST